ncbi:hypothetical protein [Spiroplasma endosymbiont of Dasysyrphus albostriatus]|uniref:hypothetical protein n=1 Tax=Spiroplasma endosymbiont of Dasysyrphus albostriatus TaxID=3066299 RepID=UPI0030CCAD24
MLDEILKVIFDKSDKKELINMIERLIICTNNHSETKKWLIRDFDKTNYVLEKLLEIKGE